MRITTVLLAACATILVGCGDSDDPISPDGGGSLAYTFTGAGSVNASTFDATGAPPAPESESLGTEPWATGAIDPSSDFAALVGVVPRGASTWDMTIVGIGRKTVGTSPIDAACDPEADACTGVAVLFGASETLMGYSYLCTLTAGSVTISAVSATSLSGTFSGTGTCIDTSEEETDFVVSGGTFNVPLNSQLL